MYLIYVSIMDFIVLSFEQILTTKMINLNWLKSKISVSATNNLPEY